MVDFCEEMNNSKEITNHCHFLIASRWHLHYPTMVDQPFQWWQYRQATPHVSILFCLKISERFYKVQMNTGYCPLYK